MPKRITVTDQDKTGRNLKFHDNHTGKDMSRNQFVSQIKKGKYPNYEIRRINGLDTTVSKPDSTVNNNLG
ncbi:hypothetical protein [Lactiplantibacillus daowaiensis]|uniref:DUF3892 domain-containing protein n=1 Tax=Lactiplantibacillus daowaiensis TaxID=2559918 RepID=A0ABW1RX25_9LACO|nr:hypothetical protein [Lactiplantibacillus daowaiensis]